MGSLKDQLLKAGLVSKEDTRKSKPKKPATPAKKNRAKVGEATKRAQRAMLDKAKKDKRLNEQRKLEAEKKAKLAEVKQLIDANKLDRTQGEKTYHFTYAKKVKKIYVTDDQHVLLGRAQLGIVTMGKDHFDLVPIPIAEKIRERDQNFVVQMKYDNDDNDGYADYQIPDDLSW